MSVERRNNALILSEHLHAGQGDLEKYLLGIEVKNQVVDPRSLFKFSDLPQGLSSEAGEAFTNSLEPVRKPLGFDWDAEYGGWMHLQASPRKLLFPTEITKGSARYNPIEDTFSPTVDAEFYHDSHIQPILHSHTHPSNAPFSASDLWYIVRDDIDVPPVAMTMHTPSQYNLLLLRTYESPRVSNEDFRQAYISALEQVWEEGRKYGEKIYDATRNIDDSLFVLDVLGEHLDGDPFQYFKTFMAMPITVEKFKLGLYLSQKDGKYNRLDQNGASKFLYDLQQKAFHDLTTRKPDEF